MSDILYQALFRIMREGTSLGDGHDVTMTRAAIIADEALRAHAIAIEARRGESAVIAQDGAA